MAIRQETGQRVSRKLYKQLYLIRSAENAIRAHYLENEMKMPMHMSIGAEAIATGVCHALGAPHGLFAHRQRPNRIVQLAFGPKVRRHLHPAHRRHRSDTARRGFSPKDS
jgi:TPP-dependent pyruvate/acetoin dehydrogenase alpha subunit